MRVLLLAILVSQCILAGDCDLRVLVRDYGGRPLDVPVILSDMEGNQIARADASKGVATFCDVGLGLFMVQVGANTCGQVQVRWLSSRAGETVEIPVYYRACHTTPFKFGCEHLFRFVDAEGVRINGVSMRIDDREYTSDRLGRIRFEMARRSTLQAVVTHNDFRTEILTLSCGDSDVERNIVLSRK